MMPIISPWIIYVIHVISTLSIVSAIAFGVLGFLIILAYIYYDANSCGTPKEFKWLVRLFVVSGTLAVLLPSEKTLLNMLVLSYVTPDNITLVQDNVVDFVTKIIGAVKDLK